MWPHFLIYQEKLEVRILCKINAVKKKKAIQCFNAIQAKKYVGSRLSLQAASLKPGSSGYRDGHVYVQAITGVS